MRFSPENPGSQAPEAPRDARVERLLEAPDLRHVNGSLARAFRYIDDQWDEHDFPKNYEADEMLARGERDQAFASRYGERALLNSFKGEKVPMKKRQAEAKAYQEFLEGFLLAGPKERVRILSKMCYADGEAHSEDRLAFTRFVTELYGHEKKAEGQKEYFMALEGQLDLLEAVSIKEGWGLEASQFDDARARLPELRERLKAFADRPLVAGVAVPQLPDAQEGDGVQRTYDALSGLEVAAQENASLPPQKYRIRIHEKGAPPLPGIGFDIVDLDANRYETADDVRRKGADLPNASVIAVAATNPEWVRAMNGERAPYLVVPGYEIDPTSDVRGGDIPSVEYSRSLKQVYVSTAWAGRKNPDWAVPVSLLKGAE